MDTGDQRGIYRGGQDSKREFNLPILHVIRRHGLTVRTNTLTAEVEKPKLPRKGVDTLREAVKRQNGQAFYTNELFVEIFGHMEARIEALEAQVTRRTFRVEK